MSRSRQISRFNDFNLFLSQCILRPAFELLRFWYFDTYGASAKYCINNAAFKQKSRTSDFYLTSEAYRQTDRLHTDSIKLRLILRRLEVLANCLNKVSYNGNTFTSCCWHRCSTRELRQTEVRPSVCGSVCPMPAAQNGAFLQVCLASASSRTSW